MERLQAAIEKARQESSQLPGRSASVSADQSLDDRWHALKKLKVNPRTMVRNRIFSIEATKEAISFDVLRTRTLRFMQQRGWTRIAVTSPTPACGKSTISLNLAFAIARQPKVRAVQIEVDLRQPSQERLMGLPKRPNRDAADVNLRGLFTGEIPFDHLASRYGDRLALATNGKGMSNASDLLLSSQVGEVLQSVEDDYRPDIMIFDMPPMLVNDDALAFTQHVDCVLLVAAAEHTTISQIDRCEKELAEHTNVLGVVLNKCRIASADGTYGYNYAYGN